MDPDPDYMDITPTSSAEHLGVFVQPVVPSPVIHWILHARVRDVYYDDVVFVGDDFVHVKQLEPRGSLRHIATKRNFDAKIRSAALFDNSLERETEDFWLKREPGEDSSKVAAVPPQMLVLTLTSDEILFLCLRLREDGTYDFIHAVRRMPSFVDAIYQLGEQMCVEHSSKALAIAAMEQELLICSTKETTIPLLDGHSQNQDWCPITSQRSLKVDGMIQNICFLQTTDVNHIVLLLILNDGAHTKATWFDWYYPASVLTAQKHPVQALDSDISTSSLLVPLKDASFLLVKEQQAMYWRDIMSGCARCCTAMPLTAEPKYPGVSPELPLWVNWALPHRSRPSKEEQTDVYIAREDGIICQLTVSNSNSMVIEFAGDLECQVGCAFASLGSEYGFDILAACGDMSRGRIAYIGINSTSGSVESMAVQLIEWLPNWASTMDMLPSDLGAMSSTTRHKHSHGFFVTSGRQPYGAVTELRKGLEVRLSVYIELDDLRSVTELWALPDQVSGHTIIVMSRPTSTQFLSVSPDMTEVDELAGQALFDTMQRTLAIGFASGQRLIQITPYCIRVSEPMQTEATEPTLIPRPANSEILAAAIVFQSNTFVFAEQDNDRFSISCCTLNESAINGSSRSLATHSVKDVPLLSRPLCISALMTGSSYIVAVATADNKLIIALFHQDYSAVQYSTEIFTPTEDDPSVCDHVAILRSPLDSELSTHFLVVCGSRDGRIVSHNIDFRQQDQPFGKVQSVKFSNSTVKLLDLDIGSDQVCAISETEFCLLEWNGKDHCLSSIENMWVSDKLRPDLSQSPITTCATMAFPTLPSGSSTLDNPLVMISEDEVLFGVLERRVDTISREIPLNGTPNRLIYSEELRCLVCSSEYCSIRSIASSRPHATPEIKRQRWPVIDFIPVKRQKPSFTYKLQPGERVHALLAWSHRTKENKTYSYILVGGSYLKSDGTKRGRVSLLQPQVRHREVTGLYGEPFNIKFHHEVFTLSEYDPLTFIACSGDFVYLYRFSPDAKKWNQVCLPFRLASQGICVGVEEDSYQRRQITISTARDSIITLILQEDASGAESTLTTHKLVPVSMGPSAELSQSHLTLSKSKLGNIETNFDSLTLLSTKDARLIGLRTPTSGQTIDVGWQKAEVTFEALLPSTLRRIRKCAPFERKGKAPDGVINTRIVGSDTAGGIFGIALLRPETWRRLSWLQRLCSWSGDLSPHSFKESLYSDESGMGDGRAVPIGLQSGADWVMMRDSLPKAADSFIAGDVVTRVLRQDGAQAIKTVLQTIAEEDHPIGIWVRAHLEEEMQAVDKIVELVKELAAWL